MTQGMQDFYIAEGFADDCDELIHRCLKEETLTFEVFSEIWKDMQMGYLYYGRDSGAEIAELSEEVIHVAKNYMLANTSNFEESVAGLFIVYALLNIQPFSRFAPLRIVPEDVMAIKRIELVARRERRLDVLYILGSVLIKGPVQYQAVLRERGMEYPIKKYLEGVLNVENPAARPKGVFYRQTEELDVIRELKNLSKLYSESKKELNGEEHGALNYVNENLATELDESLRRLISGISVEPRTTGENHNDTDDHDVDAVRSLKQKAMTNKVNPIRHRVGVCFRGDSSTSDTEFVSPPAKTRKLSNKNVTDKTKSTVKTKRNIRKQSNEDTDEDNEISGDDIDLDNFHKAPEISIEPQVNIQIDTLPSLIHCEDGGQQFQIEIIDESHKNVSSEQVKEVTDIINTSTSAGSTKTVSKNKVRAEKRDLKKTLLKSRFKRMGMLPVANFENCDK